jgi:hypothetical protein
VAINSESCVLALPHGNTTFRATSVKPYFTLTTQIEGIEVEPVSKPGEELAGEPVDEKPAPLPLKRGKRRPRKNPDIIIFL